MLAAEALKEQSEWHSLVSKISASMWLRSAHHTVQWQSRAENQRKKSTKPMRRHTLLTSLFSAASISRNIYFDFVFLLPTRVWLKRNAIIVVCRTHTPRHTHESDAHRTKNENEDPKRKSIRMRKKNKWDKFNWWIVSIHCDSILNCVLYSPWPMLKNPQTQSIPMFAIYCVDLDYVLNSHRSHRALRLNFIRFAVQKQQQQQRQRPALMPAGCRYTRFSACLSAMLDAFSLCFFTRTYRIASYSIRDAYCRCNLL